MGAELSRHYEDDHIFKQAKSEWLQIGKSVEQTRDHSKG